MRIIKTIISLILMVSVLIPASSPVFASDGSEIELQGNAAKITQTFDGGYKFQTTIKSIQPSEGNTGKIIIQADILELGNNVSDMTKISVGIHSTDASRLRFASQASRKKIGLFANEDWTDEQKMSMMSSGFGQIPSSSSASIISVGPTSTGFTAVSNVYGGWNFAQTGNLITLDIPVNDKYSTDWQSGIENVLSVVWTLNGETNGVNIGGTVTSETFNLPPAGEDSPSGGSNGLTIENNFTAPDTSYFDDAGITVTPSNNDLSFTVACNKACVVAIVNSDDTYTRLTGTAEDNAYKFTANSADDQIVVMVKGDANGDGEIGIADATQIKAAQLGKLTTLTSLQVLVSDLNGDGEIGIADATQVKAAQLGKLNIAW